MWIWIRHRNKTNRTQSFYKELARDYEGWQVLVFAGESASWRPRRASGIAPVWQVQIQKKTMFLFLKRGAGGNIKTCSSSKAGRQKEFSLSLGRISFLLYSSLQLIGQGPSRLETAICITPSTDLNVNLSQNHRHTQNNF